MLAWLRDYAKGRWLEEITDGFNQHFNTDLEPKTMRALMQNHLRYDNPELTKVGITLAKLLEAKHKKSR